MTPQDRLKIALGELMVAQLQLADQLDKATEANAKLQTELEQAKQEIAQIRAAAALKEGPQP